jgi:hypothetical protein
VGVFAWGTAWQRVVTSPAVETSCTSSSSGGRSVPQEWARWLLLVCVLSACSAAQFNGRTYRNEDLAFQLGPYPEAWREIGSEEVLIAFRDDEGAATIAVNGRCGKDSDDVPLEALTQHLFLEFTDRKLVEQRRLNLDSRAALRTEIVAQLDGVAKHYVVYVLKKNGCVYDFMHIAGVSSSAERRETFDRFVAGFRTEP